MGQAAGKQNIRTKRLAYLTDPVSGRLLKQFLPPVYGELGELDEKEEDEGRTIRMDSKNPAESFEVMYQADHEIAHKASLYRMLE
eukprot:gene38434-47453_t